MTTTFNDELLRQSIKRQEKKYMPMTFKASSAAGSIQALAAGSYMAVCDIVADVGLQPGSGMYPEPKQQIYVRFEVPAERVDYQKDGKAMNGPAVIGKFFTASMNEKANLRKTLESWRGKTFTDEEAEAFDVSTILGKACMINVVETVKGDKKYANIAAVSPLPKGISRIIPEMEPILYAEYANQTYARLPEWLQKKIDGQLINKVTNLAPDPEPQGNDYFGEITDDDIPF